MMYEMTMVYHHLFSSLDIQHGMGNYLLYMTPGSCQSATNTRGQLTVTFPIT